MAAKGFKELVLIPALTEQDFSVREARAVLDGIFDSIKDSLLRHEPVELPIGNFILVSSTQKRAYRFGKVIDLRQHKILIQPSAELELAAAAAPPSPPRPKRPPQERKFPE